MKTDSYKVGVNGGIDEGKVFSQSDEAIRYARRLWAEFGDVDEEAGTCEVSVFGYRTYSDDDNTPSHARTTFWREWRIKDNGVVSPDGR